jgi:drug/metabolite transporter, DME family
MSARTHLLGPVLVAIGAMLWGTGGVAATVVADHSALSFIAISALRLLIGGVLVLGYALARGQLHRSAWTKRSGRRIAVTAVLTAATTASFFEALPLIGVAPASAISLGVAPICVAAYLAVSGRERPSAITLIAIAAGCLGLGVICATSDGIGGANPAAGAVLAIVSAASFAALTVINRAPVPELSTAPLLGISFIGAGAVSLIAALPGGLPVGSLDPVAWAAMAVLAVLQTGLGYIAYYSGLRRGVPPVSAILLSLLEPVAAAVLSVVLLGQVLPIGSVIGIAVLLAAVVLSGLRRPRRRAGAIPTAARVPVVEAEQRSAT